MAGLCDSNRPSRQIFNRCSGKISSTVRWVLCDAIANEMYERRPDTERLGSRQDRKHTGHDKAVSAELQSLSAISDASTNQQEFASLPEFLFLRRNCDSEKPAISLKPYRGTPPAFSLILMQGGYSMSYEPESIDAIILPAQYWNRGILKEPWQRLMLAVLLEAIQSYESNYAFGL